MLPKDAARQTLAKQLDSDKRALPVVLQVVSFTRFNSNVKTKGQHKTWREEICFSLST